MSDLPAGWTAHQDPNTGNTFYSNSTTGETTWERPKAALPDGWQEAVDPNSGRTFYYKQATNETSWDRPTATPAAAAAAAPGALPEGWTEHPDPTTQKTFYYHAATSTTTWERPAAPAAASAAAANSLPPGWVEHTDPASGRSFFQSPTGETTWERPAAQTGPKGTWSTQQAQDLQKYPNPPINTLPARGVEVFSQGPGEQWTSVSRVIDALNDGSLPCQTGVGVIFSQSKDSFWLIWRSDREKEADAIKAIYGC